MKSEGEIKEDHKILQIVRISSKESWVGDKLKQGNLLLQQRVPWGGLIWSSIVGALV